MILEATPESALHTGLPLLLGRPPRPTEMGEGLWATSEVLLMLVGLAEAETPPNLTFINSKRTHGASGLGHRVLHTPRISFICHKRLFRGLEYLIFKFLCINI